MTILGVIPARYGSSRLEGKPLMDICGKPMIWWVYHKAIMVKHFTHILVATDDVRIQHVCNQLSIPNIMTSTTCVNGTERVAQVAQQYKADIYVTIQGDEPLIEPQTIDALINLINSDKSIQCATLMTKFHCPVDVVNATTPKVVIDNDDNILLISRSPIPYPKSSLNYDYYKPLGVYAFRRKVLLAYTSLPMGYLEKIEEIELLRFIENNIKVRIREIESSSIAVDTHKDLERVRQIITNKIKIEHGK